MDKRITKTKRSITNAFLELRSKKAIETSLVYRKGSFLYNGLRIKEGEGEGKWMSKRKIM